MNYLLEKKEVKLYNPTPIKTFFSILIFDLSYIYTSPVQVQIIYQITKMECLSVMIRNHGEEV